MEIRTRTDCGVGLIFRYMWTRYRSGFWCMWVLTTGTMVFGVRDEIGDAEPLLAAILVGVCVFFGGLLATLIYLLAVLVQAVASVHVGGRDWEYVVNAEGVEMSAGFVTFNFGWDDLTKVRRHGFGWRLWFGRRGVQVLVPRKAFDDQQAAVFESWSSYVLNRTQGNVIPQVQVE